VQGKPYRSRQLRKHVSEIVWPAYYLDFETTQTALPLYPGTAPYEQIVTQYSVHRCSRPGQIDAHLDYLADPKRDDRRELAERLLADLGTAGSIVVYSGFEKAVLRGLTARFPDLAGGLAGLIDRLFDLLDVVKHGCYHAEFHGSYSIKSVLPVLVPDMSYDHLDVRNGAEASVWFARMARGEVAAEDHDRVRRRLLEYCAQDTLALVRIHEQLRALAI